VSRLRPVRVAWRWFSLQEVNRAQDAPHAWEDEASREWPMLRALVAARRLGAEQARRLYVALCEARHERGEDVPDVEGLAALAMSAGFPDSFVASALDDASTSVEAREEHEGAVARFSAFGVPTVVLDAGAGPAVFGPVLSPVPQGEEAASLFDAVVALVRRPEFFELKRTRTAPPDVGRYRATQARATQA
jgi:protein-disulfide isomerase-like protein with CxxC motif